jgi:hypothetical protein
VNRIDLEINFDKITREVKALACLDHPRIIKYNASWLEVCNDKSFLEFNDSDEDDLFDSKNYSEKDTSFYDTNEKSFKGFFFIIFKKI